MTLADLGCGEAYLAQNLKQKVFSFDLIKKNEFITKCDLMNIPLPDDCIDIAIFCLSLMGTNYLDFIVESKRILKNKGLLIVCEISSRIVSVDQFINMFNNLGFKIRKKLSIKNYFTLFIFRLNNKNLNKFQENSNYDILKPCLYKKR